ncbi:MAG: flagellar protein FlgN [Pseudomonadota bacterium]
MPTTTPPVQFFSQILEIEIEQVQVLLELLNEEYRLLQLTSPEPLERLTEEKQRQIEKLEATVAQQNDFLRQHDLPPNRQGIEIFIKKYPAGSRINEQWRIFEQRLDTSRKQNEINGSMLAQNRQQITNTLNLLRGVAQGQKIYGPSGEARSTQTAKFLGSA